MGKAVIPINAVRPGLLETMAARYGLAADIYEKTVAAVAMPWKDDKPQFTRNELISCLVVANEHDLNPLTKEIYFMKSRSGVIQPIVSVDGWIKKLNAHPQFDGMEFEEETDKDGKLVSATCIIYRKDRSKPTRVTEYLSECKGDSLPWKKLEHRMLRNRVLTQGARIAVGFAGVMDHDEFEQWQAMREGGSDRPAFKSLAPMIEPPEVPDVSSPAVEEPPVAGDGEAEPPLDAASVKEVLARLKDELDGERDPAIRSEIFESYESLLARMDEPSRKEAASLLKG